jgi:SNF2 family DNA or RNA helicase
MSLKISVHNSQIQVFISWGTENFNDILMVLKAHRCQYNPDLKIWVIPFTKYEAVIQDLEDITIIEYPEDIEQKLKEMHSGTSSIIRQRIEFDISDLKVPPYPGKHPYEKYQLEDIYRCLTTNRYALYLDPGLGKSYILCSVIDYLRSRTLAHKVIVVTSPSGVYNFTKEISKFTDIPESKVQIGGVSNRRPFDNMDKDILVCNYRSFLLISDEYYKQPTLLNKKGKPTKRKSKVQGISLGYEVTRIPMAQWLGSEDAIIILDESHFIANPKARQTKVLHQVKSFFKYRFLATGTPADTEEKYYSQLSFLDDALVHNYTYQEWLQYYANLGDRYSDYTITGFKPERLVELTSIVRSVAIRRLAEDTLELPEHLIRCVYVDMNKTQKDLYRAIIDFELKAMRSYDGSITTSKFNQQFQYLTAAIDNPRMLTERADTSELQKAIADFNFITDHSKMEALEDLMTKHSGKKIIIWTTHPSVARYLALKYADLNPLVINGEVPRPRGKELDEFKADIVHTFQTDPTRNLLIAGTQVMNTAITMVSCNVQIVFDVNSNYTQYEQSLKRIHRIGQFSTVYTYILLIDRSLDALRYEGLIDKGFIDRNFLNQKYLDLKSAQAMLTFTSEH